MYHLTGTASLIVGKGSFENVSSHSKTNNGVGNAYGDGSNINMSPHHSRLSDPDKNDLLSKQSQLSNDYHPKPSTYPYQPSIDQYAIPSQSPPYKHRYW